MAAHAHVAVANVALGVCKETFLLTRTDFIQVGLRDDKYNPAGLLAFWHWHYYGMTSGGSRPLCMGAQD